MFIPSWSGTAFLQRWLDVWVQRVFHYKDAHLWTNFAKDLYIQRNVSRVWTVQPHLLRWVEASYRFLIALHFLA